MRLCTLLLVGVATVGCDAPGEAFDRASRSTLLPASERAALAGRIEAESAAAYGEPGRFVGLVDRDGARGLLASFQPIREHGHVHFDLWLTDDTGVRAALPVRADAAALTPDGIAYVDHQGTLRAGAIGEEGRALLQNCRPDLTVLPDGVTAVVGVQEAETDLLGDLWLVDLQRGTRRPLVVAKGAQSRPIAVPDGRRVLYVDGRSGLATISIVDLRSGEARPLVTHGPAKPGGLPAGFVPPPSRREGLQWTSATTLSYDAGGGVRWSVDVDTGVAAKEVAP